MPIPDLSRYSFVACWILSPDDFGGRGLFLKGFFSLPSVMSFHLGTVRILSQVWLSTGLKKALTSNPKLYYTTSLVNGAILEKLQTKESMFTFFSTAAVHRCKSKIGVKGSITPTVLLVAQNGQIHGFDRFKGSQKHRSN